MRSRLKSLGRRVVSGALNNLVHRTLFGRWSVSSHGQPLLPGISAVVVAKNEAYTIGFCLRSLVGVADQAVCIDNGSDDGTLQHMEALAEELRGRLRVDVISMPEALLGDCRQRGLSESLHQWHLRWDADMVAKTSGPESMVALRQQLMNHGRPSAWQLARANVHGDLHHTKGQAADPGEPILVRLCSHISYKEFGKFDSIRLPLYYQRKRVRTLHYWHLAGLKSADNLFHRQLYFNWRQTANGQGPYGHLPHSTQAEFSPAYCQLIYGTGDMAAARYRFMRKYTAQLRPLAAGELGQQPEVLAKEAASEQSRFYVEQRQGKPFLRHDRQDPSLTAYRETEEDRAWLAEYLHTWPQWQA